MIDIKDKPFSYLNHFLSMQQQIKVKGNLFSFYTKNKKVCHSIQTLGMSKCNSSSMPPCLNIQYLQQKIKKILDDLKLFLKLNVQKIYLNFITCIS